MIKFTKRTCWWHTLVLTALAFGAADLARAQDREDRIAGPAPMTPADYRMERQEIKFDLSAVQPRSGAITLSSGDRVRFREGACVRTELDRDSLADSWKIESRSADSDYSEGLCQLLNSGEIARGLRYSATTYVWHRADALLLDILGAPREVSVSMPTLEGRALECVNDQFRELDSALSDPWYARTLKDLLRVKKVHVAFVDNFTHRAIGDSRLKYGLSMPAGSDRLEVRVALNSKGECPPVNAESIRDKLDLMAIQGGPALSSHALIQGFMSSEAEAKIADEDSASAVDDSEVAAPAEPADVAASGGA